MTALPNFCANLACPNRPGEGNFVLAQVRSLTLYICAPCAEGAMHQTCRNCGQRIYESVTTETGWRHRSGDFAYCHEIGGEAAQPHQRTRRGVVEMHCLALRGIEYADGEERPAEAFCYRCGGVEPILRYAEWDRHPHLSSSSAQSDGGSE